MRVLGVYGVRTINRVVGGRMYEYKEKADGTGNRRIWTVYVVKHSVYWHWRRFGMDKSIQYARRAPTITVTKRAEW